MSGSPNIEQLALLKFGIAVSPQQREEALKLIKANPWYKQDFEKIKNSVSTMVDENEFLNVISTCHSKIAEIPQNSKVIQFRENTYTIRAIDPNQIASLTERAFFNSFNLERVVLNDQEEENERKRVNQFHKDDDKPFDRPLKPVDEIKNEDEDKCICGKNIPDACWVQCSNENKCRGSGWYHLDCLGISVKVEEIDKFDFTCEYCRKALEDKESESSQKRFKSS